MPPAIGQQDRIAFVEKQWSVAHASLPRITNPVEHYHAISVSDRGLDKPTIEANAIEGPDRTHLPRRCGISVLQVRGNRGNGAPNVERELAEYFQSRDDTRQRHDNHSNCDRQKPGSGRHAIEYDATSELVPSRRPRG